MPGLASYMEQYDHEHSSGWNKLLHGVGIPMIFAGIVLLILTKWIWGAVFFVGGWVFLFLGHRIEGNHPAFFQGPVYLLVGPDLGCQGNVDVRDWSSPRSGFRHCANEANVTVAIGLQQPRNGGPTHGRTWQQSCPRNNRNGA